MVHVPIRTRKALQGHSTTPDFTRIPGFPPSAALLQGPPLFFRRIFHAENKKHAVPFMRPDKFFGASIMSLSVPPLPEPELGPVMGPNYFFRAARMLQERRSYSESESSCLALRPALNTLPPNSRSAKSRMPSSPTRLPSAKPDRKLA